MKDQELWSYPAFVLPAEVGFAQNCPEKMMTDRTILLSGRK
jgi:hypothetical protein